MTNLSSSIRKALSSQIFVEDDIVVFGYGGFYEQPKGFGLDICYFHKKEFGFFRSRNALIKRLRQEIQLQVNGGRLMEGFIPQLVSRWKHLLTHEWHYDRAELMFQSIKMLVPSLAKYEDFPAFVKMVIGGKAFVTPAELEAETQGYIERIARKNVASGIYTQQYLLFNYLEKAIEKDMCELLGERQGKALFQALRKSCKTDPGTAANLQEFMTILFMNSTALTLLADWHEQYFMAQSQQIERIEKTLKKLKVFSQNQRKKEKMRKAILNGFRYLPKEVANLLIAMRVPLFVATGEDLFYFRQFYEPGFLVHRSTGKLHQMVGLGLCQYRPHATGAIFVTAGGERTPERTWHTQAEECTHFTDGPTDRERLRGGHRYSSDRRFHAAFEQDKTRYGSWQNAKALTAREWGHILLQMQIGARERAKIQARIEKFDAAIDFLHYAENERMAETFAALPIIERAVGTTLARRALPSIFAFYDSVYLPGLREEALSIAMKG